MTQPKKRKNNGAPKVLVAFPPAMLQMINEIAAAEHRTRSDLIREAMRRYATRYVNAQIGRNTVLPAVSEEDV